MSHEEEPWDRHLALVAFNDIRETRCNVVVGILACTTNQDSRRFFSQAMCRVVGDESTCAVLTVVVGSVLAVLHLVCSSCAAPASHGDVCFGVGPNCTTHDAFCSAVHHLMCCFSTLRSAFGQWTFGRVGGTFPMNDDDRRHCGCATTIHHVATTATVHVSPVTGPRVLCHRAYVP